MGGGGSHAVLLGVWEELRQAIGAWLDVRQRPAAQQSAALQVSLFVLMSRQKWCRLQVLHHPARRSCKRHVVGFRCSGFPCHSCSGGWPGTRQDNVAEAGSRAAAAAAWGAS